MLRKFSVIGVLIALLTEFAFAQVGSTGLTPPRRSAPTQAQIEEQKAAERAYQSAISRIPGPEQKTVDPWGDVRPGLPMATKKKKQ